MTYIFASVWLYVQKIADQHFAAKAEVFPVDIPDIVLVQILKRAKSLSTGRLESILLPSSSPKETALTRATSA